MALGRLKKRRRKQVIAIALICIAGVLVLLKFLPDNAFQFFRSPTEVLTALPSPNEEFRIGGLVETGSVARGQGATISFVVSDGTSSVPVEFTGILPDLFSEGQGMIATGKFVDGTFQASEILAKHDEEYMPKEVADALKEQGQYRPSNGGETDY